jgi:hypothetical protein
MSDTLGKYPLSCARCNKPVYLEQGISYMCHQPQIQFPVRYVVCGCGTDAAIWPNGAPVEIPEEERYLPLLNCIRAHDEK